MHSSPKYLDRAFDSKVWGNMELEICWTLDVDLESCICCVGQTHKDLRLTICLSHNQIIVASDICPSQPKYWGSNAVQLGVGDVHCFMHHLRDVSSSFDLGVDGLLQLDLHRAALSTIQAHIDLPPHGIRLLDLHLLCIFILFHINSDLCFTYIDVSLLVDFHCISCTL